MKKTIFFLVVCLGVAAIAFAAPAQQKVLTLEEALSRTLNQSPTLKGANTLTIEARALVSQEGRLANPEIEIEAENFAGNGEFDGLGGAEFLATISQTFELGGKRSKRVALAESFFSLSSLEVDSIKATAISDLLKAYLAAVADQRKVAIQQKMQKLARAFYETTKVRVDAGKESPLEARRAAIELKEAGIELAAAERRASQSLKAISLFWGDKNGEYTAIEEVDFLNMEIPELDQLVSRLKHSPQQKIADKSIYAAKLELEIEQAASVPDLTLSGGYRRMNDADAQAFVAAFSFDIPVFDRNLDAVEAARQRVVRAEIGLQQTALDQIADLRNSYGELETVRAQYLAYSESILPEAEMIFSLVQEGYKAGKYGYLDVLDAQDSFLETSMALLELTADYNSAVIDIYTVTASLEGKIPSFPNGELNEK
jgi:cobalt-zinc-cadmium efflux system outer membrane protein